MSDTPYNDYLIFPSHMVPYWMRRLYTDWLIQCPTCDRHWYGRRKYRG